jgi:hypothetical protein
MKIIYVTPMGDAVPCTVGKRLIIPQVKGGYQLLKTAGFETRLKAIIRKKYHGKNRNRMD